MSRSLLVMAFIHMLVLSFVWIGFPCPLSPQRVTFSYNGSSLQIEDKPEHYKSILLNTGEGAFFRPWMQIREIDKPQRRPSNVHMGL